MNDGERYLSDDEIAATYDGMRILETQRHGESTVGVDLEFEGGAESRFEWMIVYDDRRVGFDSWYPQVIAGRLAAHARAALAGEVEVAK